MREVPFRAHLELLLLFLAHRDEIVDRIQGLLNAQRKPAQYLQDGLLLSRQVEDCFFALAAITPDQSRLRGQLKEAHWASGFRPSVMPGVHNDLVDPGELMVRGFHLWRQTRWPGRKGRSRYAHTLCNSYLLRCLELLAMRLWDAGTGGAGERLMQIQGALDHLWKSSPVDQPIFVRDARWLIPVAQSPTTDELAAYFSITEKVAASLSERDRIEIHKASVQLAGGHLRSQLRHYCIKKGVSIDEDSLVLTTRNSNALDFAILVQGLVPLLAAYEQAWRSGDRRRRLELASAICQGISADPELFVNRVDLLGAYTMIETLFVTSSGDGQAVYTPMGARHVQLLQDYSAHFKRLSKPLLEDCPEFRPVEGTYSPYGVIYGFSSNITEHMALKTLQSDAVTHYCLEDAFAEGDAGKLAWVSGWRKLPHIDPEVQRLFDYPQQFAQAIFERIEHALRRHVANAESNTSIPTGRIFILRENDAANGSMTALVAELPVRYIESSDAETVATQRAQAREQPRLLHDRQEGMFAVSYPTSSGWTAIAKDFLTEIVGAGRDVKITGLPGAAAEVLKLMCSNLLALPERIADV